jgi:hypothetical protein
MGTVVLPELAPNEKRCSKCKEVKDRGEFGLDKKSNDGLNCCCKLCNRSLNKQKKSAERLLKDESLLICPICNFKYSDLVSHSRQTHGFDKQDLLDIFGVSNCYSTKTKLSYANRKPSMLGRGGLDHHLRKGDFVELGKTVFSFPKKFWPSDCKYVRIKVDKEKLQVQFNPISNNSQGARRVFSEDNKFRCYIGMTNEEIKEQIKIFRPVYYLRKGAGFYIQFYEQDSKILEPFEFWRKHGSLRNTSSLTVYKTGQISIADHIWPFNIEHAYFEWCSSTRKNKPDYLDIIPIKQSGFITDSSKNKTVQYIDFKDCFKVIRNGNRLIVFNKKFVIQHGITASDWDLKEVLPSGALRFRLYKERQPRGQSEEDIAS